MTVEYTKHIPAAAGASASYVFKGAVKLRWLLCKVVSSATVGNRQIELRIKDAAGTVLYSIAVGATQAASLTRDYLFLPGATREAAFVGIGITTPIPPDVVVPLDGSVQLIDTAAVAATDTYALTFGVAE